jgi:hypothetical protein
MLTGSTGCSIVSNAYKYARNSDFLDEFMIGHRNKVMATEAWFRVKHCYANTPYLEEFKQGFYQGYMDVANGADGCIPAVAPSQFWGWKYQSADGQAAVNAWFSGYPLGAKAAEEDGVGNWGNIMPMGMRQPQPAEQPPAEMQPAPIPTDNDFKDREFTDQEIVVGPDGKPILGPDGQPLTVDQIDGPGGEALLDLNSTGSGQSVPQSLPVEEIPSPGAVPQPSAPGVDALPPANQPAQPPAAPANPIDSLELDVSPEAADGASSFQDWPSGTAPEMVATETLPAANAIEFPSEESNPNPGKPSADFAVESSADSDAAAAATTYSLNDLGDEAIEGIFGSSGATAPAGSDATSMNSTSMNSTSANSTSTNRPVAGAETATTVDDIPFKFE